MATRKSHAYNLVLRVFAVCVGVGLLASPVSHAAERKKVAAKVQPAKASSAKQPALRRAAAEPKGKQLVSKRVSRTLVADKSRGHERVVVSSRRQAVAQVAYAPPARPSFGQIAGLHGAQDPLDLKSSVAFVMDQDTHEVLLSKNDHAVLPIASLTKLMTGLLVSEARLPMEEMITITQDDVDTEKGSRSRLTVGTTLTRGEMLHLALMSSENRAAHALGRTYPGGLEGFVTLMNAKARMLGMAGTRYVEPTGLSSSNQSSARDLAVLVEAAYRDPRVRELSTSPSYTVDVGARTLQYNNTNRLVHNPLWEIGLQKTGYISEAGQCLVMQTKVAGRKLIMVFLDSTGKFSRIADAERVRRWVETSPATSLLGKPVAQRGHPLEVSAVATAFVAKGH